LHLLEVHLMGHATRWGGTALTEPARARYLARDLFVDGLGVDGDLLGVALGVVALATAGLGLRAWRRARWVHGWQVAGMFAPYLVWVLVGQNLREQPRHVLPLVALLAVGLAASGTRAESRRAQSTTPRARWAPRVLFALIVARTGSDAYARHRDPPPGAALASYVASLPDANVVLVFGGASVRFFEGMALAPRARTSESMADVGLALTHADRLPERIFITSEVADAESSHEGRRVATFCRNPRLDRRRPCLDLFEVNPTELRLP
jgi:hypothetical protein